MEENKKTSSSKNILGRPLSSSEFKDVVESEARRSPIKYRVPRISEEFEAGFSLIMDHPKSVTFFGSSRFTEDNQYYKKARRIAERVSRLGYAVVTGGGLGIMEAANRGAYEAGGPSLGISIKLPHEQSVNKYVTKNLDLYYFFSRKVTLAYSAETYIIFPGGFGTLDEFFEIATLVQTHKVSPVPIILVGESYWNPLDNFIKDELLQKNKAIDAKDTKIYTITDDESEVVHMVAESPIQLEREDMSQIKDEM